MLKAALGSGDALKGMETMLTSVGADPNLWSRYKSQLEGRGFVFSSLGTDVNDGKATMAALIAVLKEGDAAKLRALAPTMFARSTMALSISCTAE